jgi:hypothetical protein
MHVFARDRLRVAAFAQVDGVVPGSGVHSVVGRAVSGTHHFFTSSKGDEEVRKRRLPGSGATWATGTSTDGDWRDNPATRIQRGLTYIANTYGSPGNTYPLWLSRTSRRY